jgi:hypothetical protein
MCKKLGFHCLEKIIEFSNEQNNYWFRGHSKLYGNLFPSVYRGVFGDAYDKDIISPERPLGNLLAENFLYNNFRRISPSITTNLPEFEECLNWLSLMQHYGLPTRLLDWSTNILVATYFAVYKDNDEDGELFAMDFDSLNRESGLRELPLKNNKLLQDIAKEPFHPEIKTIESYPIAFLPVLFHDRILRQNGTFTIHPNKSENYSIENALKEKQNRLIHFTIPSNCKYDILKNLAELGIEHATLFPDLEGLSFTLKKRYQTNIIGNYRPKDMDKFLINIRN